MQTNEMETEVVSKEEKREIRRNRRIRNQRMAVIGLMAMILVLGGIVCGSIFFVNQQLEKKKQQQK